MFMEERQKDIVKKLNENGRVLVSELQEHYGITADCTRRDPRMLEGKGLLQRTHGGAIALSERGCFPMETYSPEDFSEERPDYRSVAAEAVKQIREGEVIYLTASQVGYDMAKLLPDSLSVTVLTNSISVAEALRRKPAVGLIFLGGGMNHRGNCHDWYTVNMVKNIHMDKAFFSHTAFDLSFGASLHDSSGVEFARAVMENSSVNIGVYPSSKIGRRAVHSVCRPESYDLLITDNGICEDFTAQAAEMGIRIEIARLPEDE